MKSYILTALISIVVGAIIDHFFYAKFHKDIVDGKDVLIDEAKQAKEWAERKLSELQDKVKLKK